MCTEKGIPTGQAVARRTVEEPQIVVSPGKSLRDDQVVGLEAPARVPSSVLIADRDKPVLLSAGQDGGRLIDAVRVIAMEIMDR
jgi:hypothetical protein